MPAKIANFERGTGVFVTVVFVFVSNAPVVNRNLARFLEMVSSPQNKQTSSIIWSARDDGGSGGKKTSANLAAILEVLLTLDVGFWRQACKTFAAGQQTTGCFHTAKLSAACTGRQATGGGVECGFVLRGREDQNYPYAATSPQALCARLRAHGDGLLSLSC